MTDRRTFLRRMAQGAAYAAPIVSSFAAPLAGQGTSSQHKPGMGAAVQSPQQGVAPAQRSQGPWTNPPPGSPDSGRVP